MSWAAHELESYFLQKHLKVKVSYVAVLLGCLLPDLFTKLPVYGISLFGRSIFKASIPYKYHRGWPGIGFTHTLAFGLLTALLVLAISKNRAWFVGLAIGACAHVITDMGDSVGTMVFFPFTTEHFSFGMWAYAAQQGRYGDAAAYYSSLGGVWDTLWLCLVLTGAGVLGARFFADRVEPSDPIWGWLKGRFGVSNRTMLAAYRAYFVYGACRIVAWFAWARMLNPERGIEILDLHWGGPRWAWPTTAGPLSAATSSVGHVLLVAVWGAAALGGAAVLVWLLVGRRIYARAL